ncbi:hypothetical protein IRY55_02495 [Savagea sp. SN6]|uniref:Uncharacterized protein n=1 Tax=Savagea serpentis TaxID=2785297 RepID=A0A8J7G998_9BACL|nr:hypothetical protein [Savagea serpentis]MBF4500220.1 hypothetical protein [Savagea serpentis]
MQATFTELEIIEVLQNEGLEVKQNQTTYYKEKGIIQSGKSLKAFIKTIEQVFESVEVNGRGKKRIYTVGAKLDEIAEREDGRADNGRKVSAAQIEFHDNAMGLIITQDLINKPYTLSTWARHFGIELLPMSEHDVRFQKLVRTLEQGFQLKHSNDAITKEEFTNPMPRFQWFRTIDITKNFVERYNGRAKGMAQSVFKISEQNGHIKLKTVYTGVVDVDKNEYKTITEEEYEKFKKRESEVLSEHGFDKKGKFISKSMEWTRYISQNEKLITDEWKYFSKVYKAINEALMKEFGYTRAFESIQITEVSEQAQKDFNYGTTENGKEILADDMIADMHRRHFKSDSEQAQNLHKQSDFKKRFPYLVATVLLNKVDTKHMKAFEQDLLEFVANFEDYLMTKEMENGLFINADGRKERILNAQKDVKNKIKMYKLNVMQGVNAEMEDYKKELLNVELFADKEELGSVDSTEEINEDNLFSVELSSAANALIEKERRESYLLSDYIMDKNKERNVTHDLFYGLQ